MPGLDDALARLATAYAAPGRRYHDARHLAEVLAAVALLGEEADDLEVVRLAAYAHDAVYDGRAGEDEEASALLAERELAGLVEPDRLAEVVRLVRLTASHDPGPGDRDGAVLCDADLWILSAPLERYEEYAADVRAEYAAYDDATFAAGRLRVLRSFLDRPRVYRTAGAAAWEPAARANLSREAARLGAAAAPPPAGG
ncbi:putative metal-dependent HD superfamily phosphohydrolase [Motilibacter rhizosphaerae]|uniref:Putative metal-dependent HD superfamily phosphohydrolase n=1 Tax=Motilibacter rhizosphaerae TaxID=598652 RepID=A0A4Q7NQP5_9ACTN|nr:hypothetical protein [Motilibacter rhizosphaerae]RZS87553.1 putative metal-dependent HD superfamily phosphohydrolase [Motilibacter rhizosphaerae]